MKKMFAWLAKDKGTETCVIVIDTTPGNAKRRIIKAYDSVELKNIRLTDQTKADGLIPDIITDPDDYRIEQLRFRVKKAEKEEEYE